MQDIKKFLGWILGIILITTSPLVVTYLFLFECICCEVTGRLFHRLGRIQYRMLERWQPDAIPIMGMKKPDLQSTLEGVAYMKSQWRSMRLRYWKWVKSLWNLMYKEILEDWHRREDNKLLIIMDTNADNPFYKETFKFLLKYFGNYRILSGILPIDGFGVIHIKIKVVERKNDNLSIQELSESLHMRLINAFTESDGLYNIPSGYWSENTIYFPNLERNLENGYLVVMVALSKAGSNHIQGLREKENDISNDELEETL